MKSSKISGRFLNYFWAISPKDEFFINKQEEVAFLSWCLVKLLVITPMKMLLELYVWDGRLLSCFWQFQIYKK